MGLDMYLRASKYVGGWRHSTDGERNEYERMVELFGMTDYVDDGSPSIDVSFTVGYWRKANQIHSWFVRECQKGVDDCRATHVSIAELKDLQAMCLRVMASTGPVPFDPYAATVTIVDKCIALDKAPGWWEFIYQSSW